MIDGGGGVWYEHDVSDDEEEEAENGIATTDQDSVDNTDGQALVEGDDPNSSEIADEK